MAIILKRIRSEQEDEISPAKRNKIQLCSTYGTQEGGEGGGLNESMMVFGGEQEKEDATMVMDEEVEMMDDDEPELDHSNPLHPWNAPRMLHQVSTNSLSSISSSNNSFPGTPLDNPSSSQIFPNTNSNPITTTSNSTPFPDQFTHPNHSTIFPTPHNPTSFTDQNGVTRSFPPPTSSALSPYPPSPQYESDDPTAFANYAIQHGLPHPHHTPTPLPSPNHYAKDHHQYQNQMRGRIQIVHAGWGAGGGAGGGEMEEMMLGGMMLERELELPRYNWDVDRPALAMGGHQL